jgi:energy-coupling factor transporter transmembrane protein EcfT
MSLLLTILLILLVLSVFGGAWRGGSIGWSPVGIILLILLILLLTGNLGHLRL